VEYNRSRRHRHAPPRLLSNLRRNRRASPAPTALARRCAQENVLKTRTGLVWTDFEDACIGPIEWDLACFVRTSLEPSESALASYGATLDLDRLAPFFAARDLQGAAWGAILTTRFPDRKERAAEWMTVARSRYG
jgi:hypothetical protein